MYVQEPEWLRERRDNATDHMLQGEGQKYATNDAVYLLSRPWDDNEVTGLTRDVAFNRHSINDGHHVSPFDNSKIVVGDDGVEVALVQGIDEESFRRTLSAATRATIGIDISPKWEPCSWFDEDDECSLEVTQKSVKHEKRDGRWGHYVDPLADNQDWEEMLRGGLQTALETQVIVFAVKGASRTATHQLVRSRRAAFHQQSQRASYMGDFPECRMPESVWVNPVARQAFLESVIKAHEAYRTICEQDVSYQDARFVLPEGTCNFILLEYPVREFLNVYAYRGCSMFQWEIVSVMRKAREVLVKAHPFLAPYIKISCQDKACYNCGGKGKVMHDDDFSGSVKCDVCKGTGFIGSKCTFQGWENVEGQCDFAWAKEELRTFKPKHHKIERKEQTRG